MKTEAQMLQRLEETVTAIERLTDAIGDADPTPDQVEEIRTAAAFLGALAWALDVEDAFAGFVRQVRLCRAAEKLVRAGVTV